MPYTIADGARYGLTKLKLNKILHLLMSHTILLKNPGYKAVLLKLVVFTINKIVCFM